MIKTLVALAALHLHRYSNRGIAFSFQPRNWSFAQFDSF